MGRCALVVVLCIAILLAGCGQRGPLTLPSRSTDVADMPASDSPTATANETMSEADSESPAREEADETGEDSQ